MRPIAVTISGFSIGILLIFSIRSRSTLRLRDSPIAVIVPSIVEMIVAMIAMETDTYTAFTTSTLLISSAYHLSEKPENLVSDFDELNEKIIVTRIGR